jgi:aryl-alcohol dehydrogenase-like predicted oxidoreductase
VVPAGSRVDVAKQFTRYFTVNQQQAAARYVAVAQSFGLTPVQLALAFVYSRPFVTSSIIGATSVEQQGRHRRQPHPLPEEALTAINEVYNLYPDPCP